MLIGRILTEMRTRTPDKIALWFGERSWTFAELDDATDRIAANLSAAGVRAGDRVGLFFPNCSELVLGYFGCFKLGAIAVAMNYRYRQPEARYALEHSYFVPPAVLALPEESPPVLLQKTCAVSGRRAA